MKKYLKYKGVTVNAFGLPVLSSNKKEIKESRKTLRKYSGYKHFIYNNTLTAPRDTIIMFDIPSSRRSERDWLRYQLKGFNYSLIQKGVWVGPSPLPKEFIRYAESIGFLNRLKVLKLAKPYSKPDKS
jgi:DNA-binding transcriptional regulator PaaX